MVPREVKDAMILFHCSAILNMLIFEPRYSHDENTEQRETRTM
jgi:hypothetical protein